MLARSAGRGYGDRGRDWEVKFADVLRERLAALLGKDKVLTEGRSLSRYSQDGLGPSRAYHGLLRTGSRPAVAVRPKSTEEVAGVMRLATENGISVVPYGGGSGLMGGAQSLRPGIVLDLSAMDRILEVNVFDMTARVEAGVILADLQAHLAQQGLMLGHDPWSVPIATVGGAISTDGLGYSAFNYGSMGDQVLGLTVVLSDGRILKTRPAPHASTGIALNRLFIGAEGCFGIVTEAAVNVFPTPERREVKAYRFEHFGQGFAAITNIFKLGMRPSLLDYGESHAQWINDRTSLEMKIGAPVLYLGFEGITGAVEAQVRRAEEVCLNCGGNDLGSREASEFWRGRHIIADRYARVRAAGGGRHPAEIDGYCMDYIHVAIPPSRLIQYKESCQSILEQNGIQALEYGIWCQPWLFSIAMARRVQGKGEAVLSVSSAIDDMLCEAHSLDGSMEYCHGVGVRLSHLMSSEHGATGLGLMGAVKRSLDPLNILNPGKLAL